jgi:hypothetical protein
MAYVFGGIFVIWRDTISQFPSSFTQTHVMRKSPLNGLDAISPFAEATSLTTAVFP